MTSVAVFRGPAGSLSLSQTDQLWAARGVLGEGDENPTEEVMSAYLWAIMRRCLLSSRVRGYGTCWLNFAQPINPDWRRDGKFCRVGGKYHGRPECSESRLRRREKMASVKWDDIPLVIRGAVERFARGELAKPQIEALLPRGRNRLSNWASWPGVEQAYPWGVEIGGEWFLEDRPMRDGDVEIDEVKIDNRPPIALLTKAGIGVVVATAIGAYLLYRG